MPLKCHLKLERTGYPLLHEAAAYCECVGGYASRELIEDILDSEENLIDWLNVEAGLIEKISL